MATVDDLRNTPKWQAADPQRRQQMEALWDQYPQERAGYLALAQGKMASPAVPQRTPSSLPLPQPTPGPVAPGRQWDFPAQMVPAPATALGLAGSVLGTAIAPEVTIPALLTRLALPAVGGAIGGALDPRDTALEGAGREAGAQALGEGGAKLLGGAYRYVKGQVLKAQDLPRITKAIEESFPWLKGKIQPTVKSITTLFRSGFHPESTKAIADTSLGAAKDAVETMVGANTPMNPSGQTFREIDNLVTELQQKARTGTTEHETFRGIDFRKQADALRSELVRNLEKAHPGAGKLYREARRQYNDLIGLRLLFAGKGVVDESGQLDVAALSKKIQEQNPKLARRLGAPTLQRVLKAIGRGELPVGADIPGQMPVGATVHSVGSPYAFFHVPHPPSVVGARPVTRRLGVLGPAALAGQEVSDKYDIPTLLQQGVGGQ